MGKNLKRITDNLYSRLTGKYIEGRTELDFLSGAAIVKIFEARAKQALELHHYPPLSKEETEKVREYYKDCPGFSMLFHQVYAGRTGHNDPSFMPDNLYYGYIEPYYNDREAARYIDNKTYYDILFSGENMPETIVMRSGRLWFDGKHNPIPAQKVLMILQDTKGELVLKRAENSEGGAGVFFLDSENVVASFRERMFGLPGDVIVQRAVVQHSDLAKLHPESVNTLRIMTFLHPYGVKILASCVRVGAGGAKTDNLSAGGLFIGVGEDGLTRKLGAMHGGGAVTEHPTLHYKLEGHPIPGIDRAHEMVKRMHPMIPHFRLVSWDIAIDEAGEPVLIEVNASLSVIADIQVCTGPLFGDDTIKICKEVFGT